MLGESSSSRLGTSVIAKQYTKCISPSARLGKMAAQAIIAAAVTALIVLFAGGAFVPGVGIVALVAVIAYCRWWLYDRLVCLGGERCAVGWVSKVEPPDKKSGPTNSIRTIASTWCWRRTSRTPSSQGGGKSPASWSHSFGISRLKIRTSWLSKMDCILPMPQLSLNPAKSALTPLCHPSRR